MIVGLTHGTFGCSFTSLLSFSFSTSYRIPSQPIVESGLKRSCPLEFQGLYSKKGGFREAVSRILYTLLSRSSAMNGVHLSIRRKIRLIPTKMWGAMHPELWNGPLSPLFHLAPDWVYPAPLVTLGAVGSYPTFSPLPYRIS